MSKLTARDVSAGQFWPFFEHRTQADVFAAESQRSASLRQTESSRPVALPRPPPLEEGESEIERYIREHGVTRCPTQYCATTIQASYRLPELGGLIWDKRTRKAHRDPAPPFGG